MNNFSRQISRRLVGKSLLYPNGYAVDVALSMLVPEPWDTKAMATMFGKELSQNIGSVIADELQEFKKVLRSEALPGNNFASGSKQIDLAWFAHIAPYAFDQVFCAMPKYDPISVILLDFIRQRVLENAAKQATKFGVRTPDYMKPQLNPGPTSRGAVRVPSHAF